MRQAAKAGLFAMCCLVAAAACASDAGGVASVVRIRAVDSSGYVQFGSGVVIGAERIATACHVTRNAVQIDVWHGDNHWTAHEQTGSPFHDACVIRAPIDGAPLARVRRSDTLQKGEAVIAAGFRGGRSDLSIESGIVAGLYPYGDAFVIRTTAAFDVGSSGGGLFDAAGNLVGILAFKGRSSASLRFALPPEWVTPGNIVSDGSVPVDPSPDVRAFWEQSSADRPRFLGVAMRDAASGN